MNTPQKLEHPGPRAADRYAALPCQAQPVTLQLTAGLPFDQAVAQGFAAAGFTAGYLRLPPARFARLSYVIPAPAPGDGRAAWYSKPHVLIDATAAEAGLHLGSKAGAPFLHCHGLWCTPGGDLRMGHLLAPDSVLREDVTATGWGLSGAALHVAPDPETGFDLFAPTAATAVGDADAGVPALLCTMRPNEDPHSLLPQIAQGMAPLRIEGIGSLVHTRFTNGTLDSYATEVLLRTSRIAGDCATLNAVSVGFDGTPITGVLSPHANRICITAELLLIEVET